MAINFFDAQKTVFSATHQSISNFPLFSGVNQVNKEINTTYLLQIAALRATLQQMTESYLANKAANSETSIVLLVDEVLKRYIQNQEFETKCRLFWFAKKVDEALSYLKFLIARSTFMDLMEDANLSSVVLRINNQATEIEAGIYSFRDVKNILKEIDKKFQVCTQ